MVTVLIADGRPEEGSGIARKFHFLAARYSEDKWEVQKVATSSELAEFAAGGQLFDFACVDIRLRQSVEALLQIRRENPGTCLIVVTDRSVSPLVYIRPSLMVSAVLLRPITEEQLERVLREAISQYMKAGQENGSEDILRIESREGNFRVPYQRIQFAEARNKKIYLNLGEREISYYDTLDHLEQSFPPEFRRCHRSFLVNTGQIERVILSQNVILLYDGTSLPISRSYRSKWKGR